MTSPRHRPSPLVRRLLQAPTHLGHPRRMAAQPALPAAHSRRAADRPPLSDDARGDRRAPRERRGSHHGRPWSLRPAAQRAGGNAVEVAVGRERFRPRYRILAPVQASEALTDYARRNRWLAPGCAQSAELVGGLAIRRVTGRSAAARHAVADRRVPNVLKCQSGRLDDATVGSLLACREVWSALIGTRSARQTSSDPH